MELLLRDKHMFSKHYFLLALLVILANSIPPATAICYQLATTLNSQLKRDVCLKEYNTNECKPFADSMNVSLLPDPTMKGKFVEKPQHFKVLAYMTNVEQGGRWLRYPSLRMDWSSPFTPMSRRYLTGFYITVESSDGAQFECRLFKIDHTDYDEDELHFDFKFEKISMTKAASYTVKIYSLPLPNYGVQKMTAYLNNEKSFQRMLPITHKPVNLTKSVLFPAHWTSGITVDPDSNKKEINVYLTLPKAKWQYGFTNYTVGLMEPLRDRNNPIQVKSVYDPTAEAESAYVKFEGGLSMNTWYRIYVRVIDTKSDDPDECLCYVMVSNDFFPDSRECRNFCEFGRSAYFDLNGDITTNPMAATHSPSTQTTTPYFEKGKNENSVENEMIIIIAVVSVILIALGMLGVIFWKRGTCSSVGNHHMESLESSKHKQREAYTSLHSLKVKTVYLMYSSDHEHHQVMVRHFVAFLEKYCKCEVVEQSEYDDNQHVGGQVSWLADKLNKRCELIIFLDSTGALLRLKDLGLKEYRARELGPAADLFNLGLMHINRDIITNQNKKAIIVSMTEERVERCQSWLIGLNEYVVPKHLSAFLQKLHGFSSTMVNTYKSQLPLMSCCVNELPGVSDLLESIKAVQKYERENPDWFNEHFELINKVVKLERATSNTESAYGSLNSSNGQRSVTPPPDGSTIYSPFPDQLDNPCFDHSEIDDGSRRTVATTSCITVQTGPSLSGKKVIPPPSIDLDIASECISAAIVDGNPSISQFRTGGANERTQGDLIPPCNTSDISNADLSMAIGALNQNHRGEERQHVHSNGNQKVLEPRTNDVNLNNADTFSDFLQKENSDFRNDNNKNDFSPSFEEEGVSRDKSKNRDEAHCGRQQQPTIRPPIMDISNDNISYALENSNQGASHSFKSSDGSNTNTKSDEEHKKICPPKTDFTTLDLDSISCAIGNQNSNFKNI